RHCDNWLRSPGRDRMNSGAVRRWRIPSLRPRLHPRRCNDKAIENRYHGRAYHMSMTLKEMEDVLLAHEIAELEQDIDATMATVVPDPHYELSALGWIIDGQAAVREMYRRILPVDHRDVAAEKRIHALAENTLLREAVMSFNNLEGKRVSGL